MRLLTAIGRARWFRRAAYAVLLLTLGGAAFLATVIALPMDTTPYTALDSSAALLDRDGALLHVYLNEADHWRLPLELEEVSPKLIAATVAIEDQRFRAHPGVDPIAVARAAWQNLRSGSVVSGGSTLTMQLVKRDGVATTTLSGKARQALQALRLDARLPKDAILAAYLNTAPYGGNLLGCEAAARRYFGRSAKRLNWAEAALLAGLPKAPSALDPIDHPEAALARRNTVLKRLREEGDLSEAAYAEALDAPLGAAWRDFPDEAPHIAAELAHDARRLGRLPTTIDLNVQQTTQRLVQGAVAASGGTITNGAAVVVDTATAECLAYVGSADFFNTPGGGQVDAAASPRSPGSALKPFVYGLAMEDQVLYPSEVLLDGPMDYGLYRPGNFDNRHYGLVTAEEALQASLNIPALAVLQRTGARRLYDLLQTCGLSTLDEAPGHYGLGLTLGNCEVKLRELAAAYNALANEGVFRPLRIRRDVPRESWRVLDGGPCLALYAMLGRPLPGDDFGPGSGTVSRKLRVAWKTGTSAGFRDGWAFLFNKHYVVGVWMGNNDNRGANSLYSLTSALPLAASIFERLPRRTAPEWPGTTEGARPVEVCAVSGLPATEWCRHTRRAAIPDSLYLHRRCDVHYPAEDAGVIERWPGVPWDWDLADVRIAKRPPQGASRVGRLAITSPADQAEYVLTGEPEGDRIRLRASLDHASSLHWYVDGTYLTTAEPGAPPMLELEEGKHRVACVTNEGASAVARFDVHPPERFATR